MSIFEPISKGTIVIVTINGKPKRMTYLYPADRLMYFHYLEESPNMPLIKVHEHSIRLLET